MSDGPGRVLAAMSGGVDSAAAAILLKRAGWEVVGAVIRFSEHSQGCVDGAKAVCGRLGVPLEVIDARAEFERRVALPFCESYCAGRTPNPCVTCNPLVKFASLLAAADALGCGAIASGHYARIASGGGFYRLRTAACSARDQSYMLCRLPQTALSRVLFPLGELGNKSEARALAASEGLGCADAPDSQEICFIPGGDYASYIRARGMKGLGGRFISPEGERLAPHAGAENYTVGQHRGLGISLGAPAYVKTIEPGGDVRLTYESGRYSSSVTLRNVLVNPYYEKRGLPAEMCVKIRSAARAARCAVTLGAHGAAAVRFERPALAPAPGQEAALYDGEYVAACGEIDACTD